MTVYIYTLNEDGERKKSYHKVTCVIAIKRVDDGIVLTRDCWRYTEDLHLAFDGEEYELEVKF